MFTGLVEEVGRFAGWRGDRLRISAELVVDGAAVGDSIAVDGCCLTVVALGADATGDGPRRWWEAEVTNETRSRTTLGALAEGDAVNLERPLRLADRLGGHLVQGHVDGVGEVLEPAPSLRVALAGELARYVVEKGSITVDGVSLTVVEAAHDAFSVAVVPHTMAVTTLGAKRRGDRVNLELDVVAKYVERLLAGAGAGGEEKP
ncbi:MAG: riboflavin synthase [Acidimicrobiales bacterium]